MKKIKKVKFLFKSFILILLLAPYFVFAQNQATGNISIDTSSLSPGTYVGQITINADNATDRSKPVQNSPQTINVIVNVSSPQPSGNITLSTDKSTYNIGEQAQFILSGSALPQNPFNGQTINVIFYTPTYPPGRGGCANGCSSAFTYSSGQWEAYNSPFISSDVGNWSAYVVYNNIQSNNVNYSVQSSLNLTLSVDKSTYNVGEQATFFLSDSALPQNPSPGSSVNVTIYTPTYPSGRGGCANGCSTAFTYSSGQWSVMNNPFVQSDVGDWSVYVVYNNVQSNTVYYRVQSSTIVSCNSNVDCNDNNPCTIDLCNNPGTSNSFCSNTVFSGTHLECVSNVCRAVSNTISACTNQGGCVTSGDPCGGGGFPTYVISPSSATISVNSTQQFRGFYDPDGPSGFQPQQDVTNFASWSAFSKNNAGTINGSGLATCNSAGTVLITSTYSGIVASASLICSSSPPPSTFNLNVSIAGSGRVTSNPPGIDCNPNCSAAFVSGTSVTLQATPLSGFQFNRWSGDCSGTSLSCVLTMNADKSVTANFVSSPPPPPPQTHLECNNQNQCVSVPGPGPDRCSTPRDCGFGGSNFAGKCQTQIINGLPVDYCANKECDPSIPGDCQSECRYDEDCGGPPGSSHLVCYNNACVIVGGPGQNSCPRIGQGCRPRIEEIIPLNPMPLDKFLKQVAGVWLAIDIR